MAQGVKAWKELAGDEMVLFWKLLFSLSVALLLYMGMVTAFHLLNLPSDRAVLGGVCLLLLVAVGGWMAYGRIWQRGMWRRR